MAAYNVTKAGVLSFSETLYNELKPHNIGVTGVCPDFFATNISRTARFQTAAQKKLAEQLTRDGRVTADEIARQVLRAVERKQLYLFVPFMANLIWRLKRMMPVVALNIVARYMRKKAEKLAAEMQRAGGENGKGSADEAAREEVTSSR
jgi:short-subunit dehydrogenase